MGTGLAARWTRLTHPLGLNSLTLYYWSYCRNKRSSCNDRMNTYRN